MSSKDKHYRVTIEEIDTDSPKTLQFEYQDREDLFTLIDNLKNGTTLEPAITAKLALALRLLGPIMIKDRKHPLFIAFMPHFKNFMLNLKATVKQAIKIP